MIKQYGEKKGTQVFYAWVNKHGYDETKPLGGQQRKESFEWTMPVQNYKQQGDGIIIKGTAITVGETRNNNIYTEEELRLAARSLAQRPITVNHDEELDFPESQVLDAEFVDDHIEYTALIGAKKYIPIIAAGRIDHVSIEADYRYNMGDIVNGVVPQGVVFTGMSILMPDVEPGDPDSSVMVWEKLKEAYVKDKKRSELQEEVEYLRGLLDEKIGVKKSGHKTPPKGYPKSRSQYGDPTNYKYPLDTEKHVRAALAYFSKAKNRREYSSAEQKTIWGRIIRAAKKLGIEVSDDVRKRARELYGKEEIKMEDNEKEEDEVVEETTEEAEIAEAPRRKKRKKRVKRIPRQLLR